MEEGEKGESQVSNVQELKVVVADRCRVLSQSVSEVMKNSSARE